MNASKYQKVVKFSMMNTANTTSSNKQCSHVIYWTTPYCHKTFEHEHCTKNTLFLLVFNTTFNNISVISWQSVLLVEETGESGENYRPVTRHLTNLITWCWIEYTSPWAGFKLTTLVVVGTEYIDSLNQVHLTMSGIRTHNFNSDR